MIEKYYTLKFILLSILGGGLLLGLACTFISEVISVIKSKKTKKEILNSFKDQKK